MTAAPQFTLLREAEQSLIDQGFRLVPDSCDWTNAAGDDAGIYAVEHDRYGHVIGWRVEINQRPSTFPLARSERIAELLDHRHFAPEAVALRVACALEAPLLGRPAFRP